MDIPATDTATIIITAATPMTEIMALPPSRAAAVGDFARNMGSPS
jgi:hypothetical protein